MPTIFREGDKRYFFYSNEGAEPPHVHVESNDGAVAKVWLQPRVMMAANRDFRAHELNEIMKLVVNRQQFFLERWHAHFKT